MTAIPPDQMPQQHYFINEQQAFQTAIEAIS